MAQLLYVANGTSNEVSVIDTGTNAVTGHVSAGIDANAVAIDGVRGTGYVGSSSGDFQSFPLATLIPAAPVSSIGIFQMVPDPANDTILLGGFDSRLQALAIPADTVGGAAGINGYGGCWDSTSAHFFLGEFQFGYKVLVSSMSVVTTFTFGGSVLPTQMVMDHSGNVWACDSNNPSVYVLPGSTFSSSTSIGVPHPTSSLAISPDGTTIWAYSQATQMLYPIDTSTHTVGTGVPCVVNDSRTCIIILPDNRTCYVSNGPANSVQPLDLLSATTGSPIAVPGLGDEFCMALGSATTPAQIVMIV